MNSRYFKIGIFDSGFGGLTILESIKKILPEYSYIYLGDNARTPYGTRSFDTVYKYTLQAVKKLFELDCYLIIIACNTASAKALRTIQQHDLPNLHPQKRVLGIIRPSTEVIAQFTKTNAIGIFGTEGTVKSQSYIIEINKFYPNIHVYQQACPMWVPIVENGEHESSGADYFIVKYSNMLLSQNKNIDTIILGCTHYPLLLPKLTAHIPTNITIINQGDIVAKSLKNYMKRHPEIESKCMRESTIEYLTTELADSFNSKAGIFLKKEINSKQIELS